MQVLSANCILRWQANSGSRAQNRTEVSGFGGHFLFQKDTASYLAAHLGFEPSIHGLTVHRTHQVCL